jgi:NTE family protein
MSFRKLVHKNAFNEQRALVLQGGGALGAYEAGVFREISRRLSEKKETNDKNLFDVIAGTSAGALSAAILISHFLEKNSWYGSSEKLVAFWDGLKSITAADIIIGMNPFVNYIWNYLHALNPNIATGEAARRFWSSFQFDFTNLGVPKAYLPIIEMNYKFFNPLSGTFWRYDYTRLRNYLDDFIKFPIKTSSEKGEPRLLIVCTDVQDYSSAVTFDSYEKLEDPRTNENSLVTDYQGRTSRWYSEYGGDLDQEKHTVFYDGIGVDQLIAGALGKYALDHPLMEDKISKTKRQFWDGGYLSNTPLRELIQCHRDYWKTHPLNAKEKIKKVPDLKLYIVDIHAVKQKTIPNNLDAIDDREHDILFHNKTKYDEKVSQLTTDYVNLTKRLIVLAMDNGIPEEDIDKILNLEVSSKKRDGKPRAYRDLLDGRFNISKLWHIERKDDSDAIFGNFTDFSSRSIDNLIEEGENDARDLFSEQQEPL